MKFSAHASKVYKLWKMRAFNTTCNEWVLVENNCIFCSETFKQIENYTLSSCWSFNHGYLLGNAQKKTPSSDLKEGKKYFLASLKLTKREVEDWESSINLSFFFWGNLMRSKNKRKWENFRREKFWAKKLILEKIKINLL